MVFLDDKKIMPLPELLMLICAGVFSLLLALDLVPMSLQDRQIMKGAVSGLLATACGCFFLRFLARKLSRLKHLRGMLNPAAAEKKDRVPPGYKREVAREERFSFCYPCTWKLVPPSDCSLYVEAREVSNAAGISASRNFNIAVQDISNAPDIDGLFRSIREAVLQVLKGGIVEFQQNFRTNKLSGMRYKVNYRHPLLGELSCYQVVLTNENKKRLVLLTFTCAQADYRRSKKMFDEIAANVNIFD